MSDLAGSEGARLTLFVDTNTLLHFRWLAEIDWLDITKAMAVDIRLDAVVTGELDNRKRNAPRARIRERARAAISRLEPLLGAGVCCLRESVELHLNPYRPLENLAASNLDPDVNDDRLVASVLRFREENPTTPVALVTNDFNLRMKARQHDISIVVLAERYSLPDELDEFEAKLQRTEREVHLLRNRLPELLLVCSDSGKTFGHWVAAEPIPLRTEELDATIVQLRVKHPAASKRVPVRELYPNLSAASFAAGMYTPSDTEIARYNRQLEEYFEKCARFLEELHTEKNARRRTLRLRLMLRNNGTAPADAIRLSLVFPDGLMVYDKAHRPQQPKEPDLPEEPKTLATRAMLSSDWTMANRMLRPDYAPLALRGNVVGPDIRKSDDGAVAVDFSIERLIQHAPEPLEPVYVRFESWDTTGSFQLNWRAVSASLPHPVTGTFDVAVQKNPTVEAS
jgi:hypothetical protein